MLLRHAAVGCGQAIAAYDTSDSGLGKAVKRIILVCDARVESRGAPLCGAGAAPALGDQPALCAPASGKALRTHQPEAIQAQCSLWDMSEQGVTAAGRGLAVHPGLSNLPAAHGGRAAPPRSRI